MFTRLKKNRPYQYTPRFYTPDKESEARKPIRFRRMRRKSNPFSIIVIVGLMALIVYVLHLLSQIANH